jgi:chaperonin GroEL
MSKIIEYNNEARQKLAEGAKKLSKAVVSTLGPFGRNVIIEKANELPVSTKDGVTVAKSITLKDPIENIGAEIIKQAAIKSANTAGDGTTTTTLLAYSIINEGLSSVRAGANAVEIKKGIDAAVRQVVTALKENSKDISSEEQLKQVATISANNDEFTGKLIAAAIEEVGRDGVVAIEESKTGETTLEVVEGMQFDRGYKSPFFVTNNNTMQAVLEDPYILIYDGKITTASELLNVLQKVNGENKSLLIVAEDIDGEALATLIVNKMRGIVKVCAVKAPELGDRRTLVLEDMAIITCGEVISKDKGYKLDKLQPQQLHSFLGKARSVNIGKDKTTIIDGKGDEVAIEARANEIKIQIESAQSFYEKEKLQERLGKLIGGVAIINVGGNNDIELKEYKDRVEDALFATRAANEEGILPGGGAALLYARDAINQIMDDSADFNTGKRIVFKALEAPFIQILMNAGHSNPIHVMYDLGKVVVNPNTGEYSNTWRGYNLKTETYVDMLEAGILDPTKVVRLAIENAASVAGTILTTETVIYEEPVKEKKENNFGNEMGDLGF